MTFEQNRRKTFRWLYAALAVLPLALYWLIQWVFQGRSIYFTRQYTGLHNALGHLLCISFAFYFGLALWNIWQGRQAPVPQWLNAMLLVILLFALLVALWLNGMALALRNAS
ncbi:hypothetical protein GCM10023185_43160 [Hymenobacter saemangeumensis]|uniref:Uncharacterized protein n=1 Tax=Hymenobacter saemangeumensis TaxID=1084522 RepID=A0ABP8IRY3_9BACT